MDNCNNLEDKLKDALLKKALGYEYEEKQVEAAKDGKQGKVKIIKKHIPPDLKAMEQVRLLIAMGQWGKNI